MKSMRTIVVAFIAVIALSAVASATASAALPEYEFKTTPTMAEREFTGKSGPGTLETSGAIKSKVLCSEDTSKGIHETTTTKGTKFAEVVVTFKGCKSGTTECGTAGVITTTKLEGELGYIKATAPKEVGLELKPVTGAFAKFECGTTKFEVSGSIIGVITPINQFVGPSTTPNHFTVTYNETAGVQAVTKLEGQPEDVLLTSVNGATAVKSGLKTTEEIFPKAEVKINA